MSRSAALEAGFAEGERSERSAVLADLYARFWQIAALYRSGRIPPDGEAADAARVEQRCITIIYENYSQGLHQMPKGDDNE